MNLEKLINIFKLGRMVIHAVFLMYLLGALFAVIGGYHFDLIRFLYVYVILFTGTLAAMYNNNYNDVEIDKHAKQTFFSGGSRILVDHPDLMVSAKFLSMVYLCFSVLLGFFGIILFAYPVTFFFFVLFGNLLGWYYSAPPIQLNYRGFGELGTMVAVGFLLPGLGYFAVAGRFDVMYVFLLIPLLFQGFAISFYLEIPDRDADRIGHKNTLVVRYGVLFGLVAAALSTLGATLCFFLYTIFQVSTSGIHYWVVWMFSLLPLFISLYSVVIYKSKKDKLHRLSFLSVSSFFIFYILFVGYLSYIILF